MNHLSLFSPKTQTRKVLKNNPEKWIGDRNKNSPHCGIDYPPEQSWETLQDVGQLASQESFNTSINKRRDWDSSQLQVSTWFPSNHEKQDFFFESSSELPATATIYTLLRVTGGKSALVIQEKMKHSGLTSHKEAQGLLLTGWSFSSLFLRTPAELTVELALYYLSHSRTPLTIHWKVLCWSLGPWLQLTWSCSPSSQA